MDDDDASAAAHQRALALVRDQRICEGPCNGIVLHKSHQTRAKHAMRQLTEAERADWVVKKTQELLLGATGKAARVQADRQTAQAAWTPPQMQQVDTHGWGMHDAVWQI